MRRTGKIRCSTRLLTAFAVAVFLRALIAPGFMLDVGGGGPFGLQIVLCDGPAGIAALPSGNHASHQQAGAAYDHQNHDEHADQHLSATCGMWMSSSIFVAQAAMVVDAPPPRNDHPVVARQIPIAASKRTAGEHPPRAPPVALQA